MSEGEATDRAHADDLLAERREKLERLREAGIEPFPHEFDGREEIAEVRAAHEGLEAGEETESRHRVAGRIAARRGHGKAAFLDLADGSGQIQLHARADMLGEERFERLVDLDLGDLDRRRRRRALRPARGELSLASTTGSCSPRACVRRPTSSTGSRTSRPATAGASST